MIATVLQVLGVWFGLSAVSTYVWVKWRMRAEQRRIAIAAAVSRHPAGRHREARTDLDAELRHLIEDHRT